MIWFLNEKVLILNKMGLVDYNHLMHRVLMRLHHREVLLRDYTTEKLIGSVSGRVSPLPHNFLTPAVRGHAHCNGYNVLCLALGFNRGHHVPIVVGP